MMNNHPGMTDCFTPQLPISDPPSQQSTIQHHIFTSSYCLQIHQSSWFYKRKKIYLMDIFHHGNITEGHKSQLYEYLIKSIKDSPEASFPLTLTLETFPHSSYLFITFQTSTYHSIPHYIRSLMWTRRSHVKVGTVQEVASFQCFPSDVIFLDPWFEIFSVFNVA